MKLATWNVNSVRARLPLIKSWLTKTKVDIIGMQEVKVEESLYPFPDFKELGYLCSVHSQKAYNGVATCSLSESLTVVKGWPDGENDEKRLIITKFRDLTIINVYVPRGGEKGTERHAYKIYFLAKLKLLLEENFSPEEPLILLGDFNVALSEIDVYDPLVWKGRPGFMEEEREALKELLNFGLYDLFREKHPKERKFSWFDIETGAFSRNRGLRIDYIFATKPLLEKCTECNIDYKARKKEGSYLPSDHAPVYATFKL